MQPPFNTKTRSHGGRIFACWLILAVFRVKGVLSDRGQSQELDVCSQSGSRDSIAMGWAAVYDENIHKLTEQRTRMKLIPSRV